MPYVITCKNSSHDIFYVSRDMGLGEDNSTHYVRTQLIGKALVLYNVKSAMRVIEKERDRINGYTDYKICNITAYPLNMIDEEAALNFCENHECDKCPVSCNPDVRTPYEKEALFIPCFVNLLDEEVTLDYIEETKEFNK